MSTEAVNFNGVAEAALEISERRRETVRRLKEALEAGRDEEALSIAKQYVGIQDEQQTGHRVGPGVN